MSLSAICFHCWLSGPCVHLICSASENTVSDIPSSETDPAHRWVTSETPVLQLHRDLQFSCPSPPGLTASAVLCVVTPVVSDRLRDCGSYAQAPQSLGFSGQEHWSGLPCPPPGGLPDPRAEPSSPSSPASQADSPPLNRWVNSLCPAVFPSLSRSWPIHSPPLHSPITAHIPSP